MTEYYNKDITLAYEDGSSNVSIGEVKAITPPAPTSADLETTTFSTSDYRTHMQGLKDLAPMTFTVNFDSSNNTTNYHSAMITLFGTGADTKFTITFPDDATFVFYGYVANYTIATAIGEVYTADITLQPTNTTDPVFTAAT